MIDYPALAAMTAVIHEGSFERAAERLNITPSAVSQRVKGLEERLGSVLIIRGHPCLPTDLGRMLAAHYDRVRLLEAELDPTLNQLGNHSTAPLTLKIAVNADSLATWFPPAAAQFSLASGMMIDVALDDEAYTAERLRSGEVLAVVTSDPEPVQGCKTYELGALRYTACASPAFMKQHFKSRVTAATLAKAPYTRFNRRDILQARWAKEAFGIELKGPTHWVPSTIGCLDFALLGMGWGLHPVQLAMPYIASGQLVELAPRKPAKVTLYWTITRLHAKSLRAMTEAVQKAASVALS